MMGAESTQRLQQLNDEARLRLNRPKAAVYAGKEPAGLLYLSTKVPFVIVVDASHSRLYVMTHAASDGPQKVGEGLRVIYEAYMSVGQRGVGKQQRGDGKTPLGAYFTQKTYPGHVLPDLYGSGALTLNYPNDVDLVDGKTGSGIWIHGSPSDQYARAPEATDGCVVLANPDMQFLMQLQMPAGTPVFIQSQIEWVEPQKNKNLRAQLRSSLLKQDSHEQKQSEMLALLSWQAGHRKMMAVMSSSEDLIGGRASGMTPTYWIEQAQQWTAIPAKAGDEPRSARLNAMARTSSRTMIR